MALKRKAPEDSANILPQNKKRKIIDKSPVEQGNSVQKQQDKQTASSNKDVTPLQRQRKAESKSGNSRDGPGSQSLKMALKIPASPSKEQKVKTKKDKLAAMLQLPESGDEMSSNWKKLLQTGVVVYNPKSKKQPEKTLAIPVPQYANLTTRHPDVWFDNVDEALIEPLCDTQAESGVPSNPLVKPDSYVGVTKIVAMDCEMVGVGAQGVDSILARVSLVNQYGRCIYDKYVKPTERVTDYRTRVSGIRHDDIAKGEEFKTVQKDVADLIKGRILVGHALHNDFKVLFLDHPRKKIRDTSKYKPFRTVVKGGTPSLKKLSEHILGVNVQQGEHSSVQDAQAAMRLYTMHRKAWEKQISGCPTGKRQKPAPADKTLD